MTTPPGINQPIYLNGYVFNFPPQSVTAAPTFGETVRRTRDGALLDHTHRSAITEPDVSSKFRFEVDWDELSPDDVDMWNECVSLRGPFLFCPWMMWKESFSFLSGESIAGTLQRASAKDEIPTTLATGTPATDYDVLFKLDGTVSAAFVVSAMSAYRSPWASSPAATADPAGALVVVSYAPLFRVRIVDQTPVLMGGAQGGKLILEEY